MAIQSNQTFMTDLEFQQRFPELYKQQNQQAQQGVFGNSLSFGTPYQGLTLAPTPSAGGAPAPAQTADITSAFNLGNGVYGNANTPSNLASSVIGGTPLGGNVYGNQAQTNQAAFGNIAQPLLSDTLVKDVVGPNGTQINPLTGTETAAAPASGMTNELIDQLQVAEDARLQQVMREEEEKKRAAELAEEERKREEAAAEARLTPEQRVEKYTPVLQQQILSQQLTDKWSGEGHGSAEANAKDMARILSSIGITDIKQFGKIKKTVTDTDAEGNTTPREIEVFGNKVTGQEVPNTYSERQTGNAWGGTFAGKGNTGYRVQFTDDGTPVFYTTYSSSSDLHKIAPLLAIASFVPGLAPFAQGLNALIAAKQGNILGALAGFTGLGGQVSGIQGLTNASNALNFASAAKNKNILGMLSSGANLGGTDMTGLAEAAGLGNVSSGLAGLNLGGLGVSDALKAYRTVQALKSGDPSSIISAVGGYAMDEYGKSQNQNERGFASAADISRSLAGRQGAPDKFERFDLPSPDEDFASSSGLSRFGSKDLNDLLPGLPSVDEDFASTYKLPSVDEEFASTYKLPSVDEEFPSSFAEATPKQVARSVAAAKQRAYDSVGGGRGGQGGATAEQLARANAVRGNAPQGDVARLVSSLFPSAEAGSLPENRGQDWASQIPGYSPARSLAPGEKYNVPPSTYDENNSMAGRLADALGLPKEFQRNVSTTLSALPGVNMPVGALRGLNAMSRTAGAADDVGAAKLLDKAVRSGDGSMYVEPTRMIADPTRMFKLIDSLPDAVYKTPAVQEALKAAASGDGVKAFRLLESNPAAKKELLKYADKLGVQELSPYKNINLPNPAKYRQKVGGGFAGGGLASLPKKRQLAKA